MYSKSMTLALNVAGFYLQMPGALTATGVPEAMVDGRHSSGGKSRIFGRAAGMGVSAHHAEERGLLLAPLHR